jgi:hypothetical protein
MGGRELLAHQDQEHQMRRLDCFRHPHLVSRLQVASLAVHHHHHPEARLLHHHPLAGRLAAHHPAAGSAVHRQGAQA